MSAFFDPLVRELVADPFTVKDISKIALQGKSSGRLWGIYRGGGGTGGIYS